MSRRCCKAFSDGNLELSTFDRKSFNFLLKAFDFPVNKISAQSILRCII